MKPAEKTRGNSRYRVSETDEVFYFSPASPDHPAHDRCCENVFAACTYAYKYSEQNEYLYA
jgi:hypothetical protein